jgi:carboxylesterase type B
VGASNKSRVSEEHVSEDCLYGNVYAPPPPPDPATRYPVFVWVLGGGYSGGGSSEQRENGTWLVEFAPRAVVVTANYRLNLFGFLGADALRERTPDGSTGNLGISDQRAVLAWVAANAGAFGGDPADVTLCGESAGAGSVSIHLATPPASWPYFVRAGLESGAFF